MKVAATSLSAIGLTTLFFCQAILAQDAVPTADDLARIHGQPEFSPYAGRSRVPARPLLRTLPNGARRGKRGGAMRADVSYPASAARGHTTVEAGRRGDGRARGPPAHPSSRTPTKGRSTVPAMPAGDTFCGVAAPSPLRM